MAVQQEPGAPRRFIVHINDTSDVPASVEGGQHSLKIVWKGNRVSEYPYSLLRKSCRCAQCVDEVTGRPLLDPSQVPDDVHPVAISPVGNYAIQISWSDGHSSGIFAYDRLRRLVSTAAAADDPPKTG
jgi:DUF971 family protein